MITERAQDFHAAVPRGRLAGIDLGTRTIGIALCDAGWSIATPATTLPRGKFARDLAALRELVDTQAVMGLVIGLPRNMDGSESPRSQATRAFARNIAPLGRPVLLWDERWSTQAVERAMIAMDVSRARRAERVDAAAAAFILQGAIDALHALG